MRQLRCSRIGLEGDFKTALALAPHRWKEGQGATRLPGEGLSNVRIRPAFAQCVAISAYRQDGLRVLKAMLKAGVDPSQKWAWVSDEPTESGADLALLCKSDKALKLLLAFGVDPNQKNHFDNGLLHIAAHHADIESARALIEAGADIAAKNKEGKIALELIKAGPHEPEFRALFAQAERRALDREAAPSAPRARAFRM